MGVACLGLVVADIDSSYGRGGGRGGGGGGRGGGGGISRGGGGFSGGGIRSAAPTSISRPGGRGAGTYAGGGNRIANGGNNFSGGNRINGGNSISGGNRINTGDVNIGNGNGGGWGGYYDHPVAAGVVTGAVIGATAAAVGSTYYDLPPGCPYTGAYYSCGGVYYQPQYQGTDVTYVTVDPSAG